MAGRFNLDEYETVEERLKRLYKTYPQARVLTELVYNDANRFIVKAEIYFDYLDGSPVATGFAEEIVGASPVNKTSALENCETSAIGRAIGNSAIGTENGKRPSRSEMEKVERYQNEPRKGSRPEPRVYSEVEIAVAIATKQLLPTINDIDELRRIWKEQTLILEIPIEGTTLKDALSARVTELQNA